MKYTTLSILVPTNKGQYQRRIYSLSLQGIILPNSISPYKNVASHAFTDHWDEAIDYMRERFKIQPNTPMVVAWDPDA